MKPTYFVAVFLFTGALGVAPRVWADECDDAWASAQEAKQQQRLLTARSQYERCVNVCTGGTKAQDEASKDCDETLEQLKKDIPTVVLSAVTGSGTPINDVSVAIDGRRLANSLDGRSLEVDPGPHAFVFSWRGAAQRVDWTVSEGQQDQLVRATFTAPTPAPRPPAPRPLAAAPLQNNVIQVVPGARRVSFYSEDQNGWQLDTAEGRFICTLPCTATLGPNAGYQIRGWLGRTTFLGSSATASVATVSPPRGSKFFASVTMLGSAIVGGIGAAVSLSGSTQKCGYGKEVDEDGSTSYAVEVRGACSDSNTPAGYYPGSGEDLGNSAKVNQKVGLAFAIAGGVGFVGGGIWWFMSTTEPHVNWAGSNTGARRSGLRIGLLLSPNQLGMTGRW